MPNSSEQYRLKKMASFSSGDERVLDNYCADIPNIYLRNRHLTEFDIQNRSMPHNYHNFVQGDVAGIKHAFESEHFYTIIAVEII